MMMDMSTLQNQEAKVVGVLLGNKEESRLDVADSKLCILHAWCMKLKLYLD
jgi:hypothetical protein